MDPGSVMGDGAQARSAEVGRMGCFFDAPLQTTRGGTAGIVRRDFGGPERIEPKISSPSVATTRQLVGTRPERAGLARRDRSDLETRPHEPVQCDLSMQTCRPECPEPQTPSGSRGTVGTHLRSLLSRRNSISGKTRCRRSPFP